MKAGNSSEGNADDLGDLLDAALLRVENLADRLRQVRARAGTDPEVAAAGFRAVMRDLGRLAEQYGG